MDDSNFDEKTALQWINTIESATISPRDNDIYPILNGWLSENEIRKVLEIGCGQGICSDKIDLIDRTYIGVEPSNLLIERAKDLYANNQRCFIIGNAYSLPFENSTFDGCFSVAVWHLLNDLPKAMQELSRILKKNGNFNIISANPDAYSAWKSLYKEPKIVGNRLEGIMQMMDGSDSFDVLFLHSKDEILRSCSENGLNINYMKTFRPVSSQKLNLYISIQGRKL